MKKKKIVITAASVPFVRGGAELHVEALQRELLKREYDCEIVRIPFKWYPKEEILKHAFMWRLLDISESNGEKIDLVIATKFPSYWVKHEKKVTWLIHQFRQVYDLYGTSYSDFNNEIESDRIIMDEIRRTDNITLKESKKIFTNAKNTSKRLRIFNNIDGEPLYHPPNLVGRYYNAEMGDYILSVGRLDSTKRVDLLINSLHHVSSNVKCIIAGSGSEADKLRKITAQYGLESRIKFTGFVSDEELLKLYANCFAVYFAPFDEDYGYITLEAFLSHKPVITTEDAGGVLEFVIHQENGLICKPNPLELAGAINSLYDNKNISIQYGESGYEKIKNISWDNVIDRLTETL